MSLWSKKPATTRTADGVTFAVDSVTPATTRLKEEALFDSLTRRTGRTFIALPDAGVSVVAQAEFHPLIEAIHRAFAEHRSLVLSPDDIWLTITQGFGHHVVENAEALRSRLVGFEGKRELAVLATPDLEWPDIVSLWSASVREYIPPRLHAALVCDFSTTTPAIRTASEVAVLDAFQRYFDYVLVCICGIPEVTLRGSVDDWRSIRQRVESLAGYEIDHWVARLRPILDEFVKSAEGNPDKKFWQSIYKPASAYGGEVATGWITDLFPYLESSGKRYANRTLNVPREGWALPQHGASQFNGYGIEPADLPSGLSCAPFTVRFETTPPLPEQKRNLLAGFLGVVQSAEGTMSAHIGWSVTEGDPIDMFWDALAARFPATLATTEKEQHSYMETPAELAGFYSRFAELPLFPETAYSWRIAPAPFMSRSAVFAQGPDDWLLTFRFTDYTNGRWSHSVAVGKLPVELRGKDPAEISESMPDLVEVRELNGDILEVLGRLIEAEGDIEKVL